MSSNRLAVGFHAVMACMRSDPASINEILVDENRSDIRVQALLEQAQLLNVRILRVTSQRLMGLAGNQRHPGVVALLGAPRRKESLEDLLDRLTVPPLLLVLDGVTDPHNVGACLRVADAAGVHAVIVPKDRAAGLGSTVSKVASGAAESLPYFMVTNLARALDDLKERGIWIVGTDADASQDLYSADLPASIAWVMGSEGDGMRRLTRERCDILVRIPMLGHVQSLNVSVASGVCLFESLRRRKSKI